MSNKFELEKSVTDAFLRSKGVTRYKLIRPESDPPDIIVQIGDKLIGIEVTLIHNSQSQIRLENSYIKVFSRVRELLIKSGIDNLVIRVESEKIKGLQMEKCAEVIVNTCLENLNRIGYRRTELIKNPIPGIKKIVAFRMDEAGIIITFDSRSNTFGPLRSDRIESVIEDKIRKLNKAKQEAPKQHSCLKENWLLMTIAGTFYSNYAGVADDRLSISLENCYDRIFVCHEKKNWIKEISAGLKIV